MTGMKSPSEPAWHRDERHADAWRRLRYANENSRRHQSRVAASFDSPRIDGVRSTTHVTASNERRFSRRGDERCALKSSNHFQRVKLHVERAGDYTPLRTLAPNSGGAAAHWPAATPDAYYKKLK